MSKMISSSTAEPIMAERSDFVSGFERRLEQRRDPMAFGVTHEPRPPCRIVDNWRPASLDEQAIEAAQVRLSGVFESFER